jgi:elongation factor Ts
MECKAALQEAGGDFDKAKAILREKGKAAAAKRADRSTSEGIALFVTDGTGTVAAGVVVECETDFVAKNESFQKLVSDIAANFLENAPADDPNLTPMNGKTVGEVVQEAVAVIRENIVLKKAVRLAEGKPVAVYNHHDKKKASAVVLDGTADNLRDAGFQVAIQTVAFPPQFLNRDQVPADIVAKEIEIETQRAVNEGKPAEIAAKAAQGRVNKEFFATAVLLEQAMYSDQKKSVTQYLQEEGKAGGGPISILNYTYLAVGQD